MCIFSSKDEGGCLCPETFLSYTNIIKFEWSSEKDRFYLVLAENENLENVITLECFNVKQFFMQMPDLRVRLGGLELIDVRDRLLEDVGFYINDYEDGLIKFYCGDLSIFRGCHVSR